MALRCFNPKARGHLVLRELGLVVEFPLGTTVLIPSTVITHHNVKVQQGEMRYSFTQYAARLLFSYLENRMRSKRKVKENRKPTSAEMVDHAQVRREHWE
jgi:hypothetical protein